MTAQVTDGLRAQTGDGFDLTTTTQPDEARRQVRERTAQGAIVLTGDEVVVVTASAGGPQVAAVVRQAGTEVAARLGAPTAVEDVAPLAAGDATGTMLFFLLVPCTVGAFLSVFGPAQVRPVLRTRELLVSNLVTAVAAPLVVFAILRAVVGDLGAAPGAVAGMLGVAMLYTLTVGLLSTLVHRLVGIAGILLVIVLAIALNLPSAGGSVPAALLPPFWQGVHDVWMGSAALEAMRGLLYFGGAGAGRWVAHLTVWAMTSALLLTVVTTLRRRALARPNR